MIKQFNISVLFFVTCGLLAVASFAQDTEPGTEESADPTTRNEDTSGTSHETEVTEDNYRRFMELRDQRGERNPLPASAYVKPASLEKMQNLPEASQKHLRNEMRDIILQGEQWTPEQLDKEYPYTPSDAAQSDRALQEQESEAWDELVSEYHAREADIYAHSGRSQAASARTASAGESGAQSSEANSNAAASGSPASANQGSAGSGAAGSKGTGSADGQQQASPSEASRGETSQREISQGEASTAGTFSANPEDSPDSVSNRGVSQNALEFLMQSGNAGQAVTAREAPAQESSESTSANQASESGRESDEIMTVSPGVIAIEDLDKVQGVVVTVSGPGEDGENTEKEKDREEPPEEETNDS